MPENILPIEQIGAPLHDLLENGESVVITSGGEPTWICQPINGKKEDVVPFGFGAGKGMLTIISDDDDYLADFAEYMP